ncbi:helix-turn-helix domain-containing protein [Nocardioides zeae]
MRLKSPEMLRQYMSFKGLTVRQLARSADVSHATIGHLRSGARVSARPETARAIEEALQCPPGLLFEARSSKVAREVAA